MVLSIVCMAIVVKEDVELWECISKYLVILLIGLLWCETLLLCLHDDWCSVCIRPANESDVNLQLRQESDKYVCRHVCPEVTDVHLTACIWKSACYKHWIFSRIISQFSHTPFDIDYNLP